VVVGEDEILLGREVRQDGAWGDLDRSAICSMVVAW
jgi:hypothetical protein